MFFEILNGVFYKEQIPLYKDPTSTIKYTIFEICYKNFENTP